MVALAVTQLYRCTVLTAVSVFMVKYDQQIPHECKNQEYRYSFSLLTTYLVPVKINK